MNSEFILTQGAGQKLEFAVQRNGGTTTDIDWLSAGDNFKKVSLLARGQAGITIVEHIIDLDAPPLIPVADWSVEEHRPGGKWKWGPSRVDLWLSPDQQNGKVVTGHELAKQWAKRSVFNANLLDYLLDHPQLIPESWKQDEQGQTLLIYFPGTKYRDSDGNLYVRYLYWRGGHWQADGHWLDDDWDEQCPAAVLAS